MTSQPKRVLSADLSSMRFADPLEAEFRRAQADRTPSIVRTPFWLALLLVSVHLGMELFTDTAWWQYLCLAGLLMFLPPGFSRAVLDAVARPFAALARWRRSLSASAATSFGRQGDTMRFPARDVI